MIHDAHALHRWPHAFGVAVLGTAVTLIATGWARPEAAAAASSDVTVSAALHTTQQPGVDFTVCNQYYFPPALQQVIEPDGSPGPDRDYAVVTVSTNGADRDPTTFELGAPRRTPHCTTSTVYGTGTITFSGTISWPGEQQTVPETFGSTFSVPAPATAVAAAAPVATAAKPPAPAYVAAAQPAAVTVTPTAATPTIASPTPPAPVASPATVAEKNLALAANNSPEAPTADASAGHPSHKVLIWLASVALAGLLLLLLWFDRLKGTVED